MAISQAIAPIAEPNAHSSGFIRMLYRPWLDRAIAATACVPLIYLAYYIRVLINAPDILTQPGAYALARAQIFQTMNVYGIKMAGVFMFSTSTILLRTSIVPRWIAFLGYGLSAVLLLSIGIIRWIPLVFPIWVLLISVAILFENPTS